MGRASFAVLMLTGCAQIWGIHDTTGAGDDTMPSSVSLAWERISLGTTAIHAPQDLTGMHATYLVPDSSDPAGFRRVMAEQTAVDTWTAPLTAAAPVLYELPDYPATIPRLWDFPAPDLRGSFGIYEHPNPTPAPSNAQLAISVTLPSPYASEGLQIYTVGSWTVRGFSGAEIPAAAATTWNVTVPFSTVGSLTGRPLEKVISNDAVLALRYTGADLSGVLEATPFDMVDGANAISGAMQPVTKDQPIDVRISPASLPGRFGQARPVNGGLTMQWSVVASPGYEVVSNLGPVLTSGSVAMTTTTSITGMYGNPFTAKHDWPSVFTWVAYETRTVTPPGQTLPVTLYTELYELAKPTGTTTLDLAVGLPITITMNGKPLTSDGMTVTVDPNQAVDVSFQADVVTNTFYQLQVFELVPNLPMTPTALVFQNRLGASGSKPQFKLPPELFTPGKYYVLRAVCIGGGFPGVADGDLRTRTYPQSVGLLDGGVIQVVAP